MRKFVLNVLCFRSGILLYKFGFIASYILRKIGRDYGIGRFQKLKLVCKMFRNSRLPGCASTFTEHLVMATELLNISQDYQGDVAEFGCYRGLSTANLSLICKMVGRRLYVFDSFEGLPEPQHQVTNIINGQTVNYKKGDLLSRFEEVKSNVSSYGAIEVCTFVMGYFDDTLKTQPERKYVMVFEDVDLPESVRTVIIYGWPRLVKGCKFFSHEARDLEVTKIFFQDAFWEKNLGVKSPGLVGSGMGLPLDYIATDQLMAIGSCLSYIPKLQ